jgi:hypothetical protein
MTQENTNPFARDLAEQQQAATTRKMVALLKASLAEAERGKLIGLALVTITERPDGQAFTQAESVSLAPWPLLQTGLWQLHSQVHEMSFPRAGATAPAPADLRKMSS